MIKAKFGCFGPDNSRALEAISIKLTPRQKEIVRLLSNGLVSSQIGKRLNIAEGTVNFHYRDAKDRIGYDIKTRSFVCAKLILSRIIEPPEGAEKVDLSLLTSRELQMIDLASYDLYGKEVANLMGIAYSTMKGFHCVNIFQKLGATNLTHAISLYVAQRIMNPGRE